MKRAGRIVAYVFMCSIMCLFLGSYLGVQDKQQESIFDSPDKLVQELYKSVSFSGGMTPDWEKVKNMFIKEAVVVLRSSRTGFSVFTREGFVDDFVTFIRNYKIENIGFTEKVVKMKTTIVGETAYCLVLYEASIPGRNTPAPQQGVDNFHLLKRDGQWKITAIMNEVAWEGVIIPEELRE